jgi:hypothetical protein
VRRRDALAAAASATGAGAAHLLDLTGRLPGVHETAVVRTAMTAPLTGLWLLAAAAAGVLAARSRRPAAVAVPAALGLAAVPELVGRLDPGAVVEPAALAGAALQALLVLVALALVAVLATLWLIAAARTLPTAGAAARAASLLVRVPATGSSRLPCAPRAPPRRG